MATTSPTLLSRVRNPADHSAWAEFDARYRNLILGFCTRRGVQLADAEDIRQAVMLQLASALRDFRYDSSIGRFRGFLGRTVRNVLLAQARNRRRRGEVPLELAGGLPAPSEFEEAWERDWVLHHYRLALAKVRKSFDPRSLDVFQGLLDGQTPEEVATAQRMNVNAVYKVKQRIRDALRKEVTRQVAEDEFPEVSSPLASDVSHAP